MQAVPRKTPLGLGLTLPLAVGLCTWRWAVPPHWTLTGRNVAQPRGTSTAWWRIGAQAGKEPDNLPGWVMLGRSYKMLGRNQEAEGV